MVAQSLSLGSTLRRERLLDTVTEAAMDVGGSLVLLVLLTKPLGAGTLVIVTCDFGSTILSRRF